MRLTRRELAGVAAGLAAARAAAQAPSPEVAAGPSAPPQSALDSMRKTAAEVRKIKVPIEVEPAFAFRAW